MKVASGKLILNWPGGCCANGWTCVGLARDAWRTVPGGILALAGSGFALSSLGAGVSRLTRDARRAGLSPGRGCAATSRMSVHQRLSAGLLARRWRIGLMWGWRLGALLTMNEMAQPASPRPSGAHLVWALFWLGWCGGVIDALLLNVLPVWVLGSVPVQEVGSRSRCEVRHARQRSGLASWSPRHTTWATKSFAARQ